MKTRLFVILLTSLLFSCNKDDVGISNELTGQWYWESTCGGVVGCVSSTSENHMTMHISETEIVSTVFNRDGKNSISRSYQLLDKQYLGGSTIYKIEFTDGKIFSMTVKKNNLSIGEADFLFFSSYHRFF